MTVAIGDAFRLRLFRACQARALGACVLWFLMASTPSALSGQWNPVPGGISYTAGNVAIGTTSPSAVLEIQKPSTIGLFKVGDGTNSMIWYGDGFNDVNSYGAAFRFYSATNGIQFRTGV
jgi:hypothetical protein